MALIPAVVTLTAAPVARRLADLLGAPLHARAGRAAGDLLFDDAPEHLRALFAAGTPIVGVCAAGVLIRALAPLLGSKREEPPVLAVAPDGSAVVPLLGGHRGANALARRVAEALGVAPSDTTAAFGVALDEPPPGWRVADPDGAKSVMAALLAGEGAEVVGEAPWLSGLPRGEGPRIAATAAPPPAGAFHVAPLVAALGVGCARGCPEEELLALAEAALAEAGLAPEALAAIGTLDLKADEGAILALARRWGVPLRLFSASELAAEEGRLATPSEVVRAEVGTPGVAEAAALRLAGGELVVPKRKSANATCAVALAPVPEDATGPTPIAALPGRQRGRLSVVGIGPGQASWRTPEASRLIHEAEELVGYGLYLDLLGPLAHGKPRADFPLGGEEDRCRHALERAGEGANVALVCSGDAGIYAMAALVFELLDLPPGDPRALSDAARRAEVVVSPGVSALQAAAARAGAPLGHDFAAVSLSDLLTPREDILRRLRAAAEGDFVLALYNPVSRTRRTLLAEARAILLEHRAPDTPVLLAASLGRPEERVALRTLEALAVDEVDMLTTVLIGSTQSRVVQRGEGPRLYTPRGYARKAT